RHSQT
ncbi:hypothetical protein D039_5252B, partial [Vibrio parahaemolyticus EKP-028]